MKKIICAIFFTLIIFLTSKTYAAGTISISCNKSNLKIGDEFALSISLTREQDCITNSKSYSRYK